MKNTQLYSLALLKNESIKVNIDAIDFSKVIRYLKKNKISLIGLKEKCNNPDYKEFFYSSDFNEACLSEIKHYENWREDFIVIKKEWEKVGIDYMFHKSTGQFPYMSDNLDVLVRTEDFKKAGEILIELGYVNLRNIQEAHKEFYRKFEGERVIVPIHLHERVCWSVPYEDNDHLWANYKISEDKNVYFPDFEDGILINTAHCFLEDHLIKTYDLLTIKNCVEKKDIDWDYIIRTARKLKWEHSLHTAFVMFEYLYQRIFNEELIPKEVLTISKSYVYRKRWISRVLKKKIFTENLSMPFKIPHLWTRIHSSLRELRDPSFGTKIQRFYQTFGSLLNNFIRIKLGVKNHPQMLITFSGLDGTGKTKHIETLQKNFEVCEINSKVVWSRVGSLPFTQFILTLLRGKKKQIDNMENNRINKKLPRNRFTNVIWRILNMIDVIIYFTFKVRIPRLIGKVILCDRYLIDAIIDLESNTYNRNYNRFSYKILRLFLPKPDISLFIDTPVEIIKGRAELSIDEDIEDNYHIYKNLLKWFNYTIIDNLKKFEESSHTISRVVLNKFFNKFPQKYKNYKVISYRYK